MDNLNGPTGLLVAVSSLMFLFFFFFFVGGGGCFLFFIYNVKNENLNFITLIKLIKCNSDN